MTTRSMTNISNIKKVADKPSAYTHTMNTRRGRGKTKKI